MRHIIATGGAPEMVWLTARVIRRSDREMDAAGVPPSSSAPSAPSSPTVSPSEQSSASLRLMVLRRDVAFWWLAAG
jgi:hypothetical protein